LRYNRIGFSLNHVLGFGGVLGLESELDQSRVRLSFEPQKGECISKGSRFFLHKAWSPSFS